MAEHTRLISVLASRVRRSGQLRTALVVILLACIPGYRPSRAEQASPRVDVKTMGEASGFSLASNYDDTMKFLKTVAAAAPELVHLTTMGATVEGRPMPLVIVGANLPNVTPAVVRASGKVRVWIQANTHGGDVDGKESALMLIRDMAAGKHWEWLPSMVLLINPIYNADGNERLLPENKANQNGPVNGTGRRSNAGNQDLMRDHVQLNSPEASAFVKMLTDYDPHIGIDLHTSEAVCSGYTVMYAPPVNPNTSEAIVGLLKNEWLPFVTKNLKTRHAIDAYYHGTVEGGDSGCGQKPAEKLVPTVAPPTSGRKTGAPAVAGRGRSGGRAGAPVLVAAVADVPAWSTFEHLPSLGHNYLGLRNRFAIIGESHAFASFEDRITATRHFLNETLTFVWAIATKVKKATQDADAEAIIRRRLPTAARPATGPKIDVLMGEIEIGQHPATGAPVRRRTNVVTSVQMTDRLWFEPTTDEVAAAEYYLPAELTTVVDLLKKHGIQVRQLEQPSRGVERFSIAATGALNARNPRLLTGEWQADTSTTVPAGTWVVRMNQRLARLAFYLLEPTSDDGVVKWGMLDEALADAGTYPILRKR